MMDFLQAVAQANIDTSANLFSVVVLVAAAIGLIVNTLVVLGVAWKGGGLIGSLNTSMGTLSVEVGKLRDVVGENATILTRTVAQLDGIEQRVRELEEWRNRDRRS